MTECIDKETLSGLFEYHNGRFFWKETRGSNAIKGEEAGGLNKKTGYRDIHICGKKYREHRLIFLFHYGFLPEHIDHINHIKDDNRIENLRAATASTNQMNSRRSTKTTSGYRGVRFVNKTNRWAARIYVNGKEIRIGTFLDPETAYQAYKKKAVEVFGEFACNL